MPVALLSWVLYTIFAIHLPSSASLIFLEKLPVDAGPDGHRHCQSRPVSAPSTHPFESIVGTLEVLNTEFSVVLWRRGVPVGVVYAGNNAMFRSEVFPQRTGGWTVLIRALTMAVSVRSRIYRQFFQCCRGCDVLQRPAAYLSTLHSCHGHSLVQRMLNK